MIQLFEFHYNTKISKKFELISNQTNIRDETFIQILLNRSTNVIRQKSRKKHFNFNQIRFRSNAETFTQSIKWENEFPQVVTQQLTPPKCSTCDLCASELQIRITPFSGFNKVEESFLESLDILQPGVGDDYEEFKVLIMRCSRFGVIWKRLIQFRESGSIWKLKLGLNVES